MQRVSKILIGILAICCCSLLYVALTTTPLTAQIDTKNNVDDRYQISAWSHAAIHKHGEPRTSKPSSRFMKSTIGKQDMEKLAKCDNVACKISGIIARASRSWTTDALAPANNFCLDTFGSDRVVFGGDWPVCKLGASFADCNRATADQKKLFHDNAQRVYRV